MTLGIADFKSNAEMLGRFANIREGAPEPTDRILIQCDRVLKFVAGDDHGTVVVDTGAPVAIKGKALVSARLLLQAAKTLRGKGAVTFELDGKGGAVLKTNTGGKVVLPRVSDTLPRWVRPSDEPANALVIETPVGLWPDLAKVIGIGPDKHFHPWDKVHFEQYEGQLSLVWTDNYRWVSKVLGGVNLSGYKYFGSVPVDFIKSLKAFEGTTSVVLQEDRMAVYAGGSSAMSRLGFHSPKDKALYDSARLGGQTVVRTYTGATVNRKDFIDNLKAVSSADEHGRVTVMVNAGEVKVYGYGREREGSMTMNASKTQGRGYISFREVLATKLLSGLKDKEVTFLFPERGMGPVQFKETKWGLNLYLAPVAL